MSLEQVCADLRRRPNGLRSAPAKTPQVDIPAIIGRLIESNQRRGFSYGMDGCAQVFASFVEAKTYKRIAAEALMMARRFRENGYDVEGEGYKFWIARAQHFRRAAHANG